MRRREFVAGLAALMAAAQARAVPTIGDRLAAAARAQLGVTSAYDPSWSHLKYPNGDVDRSRGVCADVVIRAARDALGLDLQMLVHQDMTAHFDSYPARHTWGQGSADANIDHRRVLNLQTYFSRAGCCLWKATGAVSGDAFPLPLAIGDIVTWLLDARLPHIGIVCVSAKDRRAARIVHNIGRGVEESPLAAFAPHRAAGHYRWPRQV